MSGPHAHALYVHGHSRVHALPPQCKLVAQLTFVVAVVATPREAFWAFAAYAAILLVLIALAEVPFGFVARRLVFEVPFLLFAVLLPFIGQGEQVEVLGLSLSVEGLWGAWNILAKATLGLGASILVAATTTMPEFLRGFERLRIPQALTSTLSFMIRYFDVIADDMRRMRVARQSRGHDPRWIWQAKAVATSAGALFIRSYERGERVHLAMLSRGYAGSLPRLEEESPTVGAWATALLGPGLAVGICAAAWLVAS
ncbi:MAG TPA: cobalt ECF transporter T component CbiQ [Actinomycetota bacterium]